MADLSGDAQPLTATDPDTAQIWATDTHLCRALDALTPLQRDAVELVYGQGLLQRDAATALDLSPAQISAVVAAALRTIADGIQASARPT